MGARHIGRRVALAAMVQGTFTNMREHVRCAHEGCRRCVLCNSLQCGARARKPFQDAKQPCREHA